MNLIHKAAEWSADHIHNISEFTIHHYRRIDATKLLVSKYNTLTIYGTLFNHNKETRNYNSNLKSLCDVCSPLLYFSGHRLPPSPRLILIRNRLNTAHGSFRSTLQKVVTFFPEMFPLSASFFFTNPRRGRRCNHPATLSSPQDTLKYCNREGGGGARRTYTQAI